MFRAAPQDNTNCAAVNYASSKFQLAKSPRTSAAVGNSCYVKGGRFVESNGYMWDHRTDAQLSGYYNDIVYKSDKAAYSVCAGSTDCKGITQISSTKYRTNTGVTPTSKKGYNAYIQGSKLWEFGELYFQGEFRGRY